jgi:hypothetical protein
VLALAYSDGHHFTTSRRYFSHFDGLEDVTGFHFCSDVETLTAQFLQLVETPAPDPKTSDEQTLHYLYRDSRSYASRVADLIETLV